MEDRVNRENDHQDTSVDSSTDSVSRNAFTQNSTTDDTAQTAYKKASSDTATKTVEIKISLPNFTPITSHPAYNATKTQTAKIRSNRLIMSGIILAVIASVGGSYLFPNRNNVTADKGSSHDLQRGTPQYATVLPAGKTIQDLGGWTRVSPTDKEPVYAYIDAIGMTKIIVSQQPLPKGFKSDKAEKLAEIAKNYNATEKITVDGETVHIGTSQKGPQSLILSRNDLLILIKSSVQVDSNEWAKYINSLR